jgi:hypothetical protein
VLFAAVYPCFHHPIVSYKNASKRAGGYYNAINAMRLL